MNAILESASTSRIIIGEALNRVATRRDTTIDAAKGIAIVAIVLGHVLRGLSSANIVDGDSSPFLAIDRTLYMSHLAIFALLSGIFVQQGVIKRGVSGYLRPRVSQFIYLYLLWQIIQIIVKLVTSQLVNSPVDPRNLITIWVPEGQLWFLPFLILVTIAAAVSKPWGTTRRSGLICAGIALLSLLSWGFDGGVAGTQGIGLAIFFFAGTAIGSRQFLSTVNTASIPRLVAVTILAGLVFALILILTPAIPPTINNGSRSALEIAWGFACATAALVAVIAFARLVAKTALGQTLAFLGARSMEIFLAHIIAASGTRIALAMAGVEAPVVHILVGTIAGIVLPLVLWRISVIVGVPWLFAAPDILTHGPKRRSAPVG